MHQRTGSVYLDAPAQKSRKPAAKNRRRRRSAIAATFVTVGILALTAACLIAGLRLLVLDPEPALTAVDTAFDDPIAREDLEAEIARGVEEGLVGAELTAISAAFDLDVVAEADRVALTVLDDPSVREELRLLATEVHRRLVVESDSSDIELAPLTGAVLAVLERESPRLAAIIPPNTTLWTVEGDSLPNFTATAKFLDRVLLYSLIAILFIPVGLVVHPRRHQVAAWVGRWALAFGLSCALAAVGLPYLVGELTGYRAAEVAVRAVSLKLIAPAVIAGISGMGLVSFAAVLRHRGQRRVSDEGAAAALGYDEPPLHQQPGTPMLDLPSRGLIDVQHPLTNI